MKFLLSEEDAATFGCPREIEFDETRLTGREAIAMKKLTGWTLERLGQAGSERAVDALGQQLWDLDEQGQPKLDEAGQKIPLFAMDPEALLVMVWLAVRRATPRDVPWDTFDINLAGLGFPEEEPGKAPPKTRSVKSSTTSKSATRGTRRR